MIAVALAAAWAAPVRRPADPLPLEVVAIPPREPAAPDGTAFASRVRTLPLEQRWAEGVEELVDGNVPYALRTFWPVKLEGQGHEIWLWVSPDYLAIGSDDDHLAFPLDLPSVAQVALAWDCALPTPKIVDTIYQQARWRAEPVPLPPGPDMEGVDYALRHRDLIGPTPDVPGIFAGTKKDLVLTPMLQGRPGKEAIYGWHDAAGVPIQPLSLWHRATYADYSHGIRLVFGEILVDGRAESLWDALADPALSAILSDEGPLDARGLLKAAVTHPRPPPR